MGRPVSRLFGPIRNLGMPASEVALIVSIVRYGSHGVSIELARQFVRSAFMLRHVKLPLHHNDPRRYAPETDAQHFRRRV